MTLGQVLIELRRDRKLSLRQVKEATGIATSHLCGAERSKTKPGLPILVRLAEYYGVTLYDIFCTIAGSKDSEIVFNAVADYICVPNPYVQESWIRHKVKKYCKKEPLKGLL